jgi:glycosyltransferase involved in cell wall biosynthesis
MKTLVLLTSQFPFGTGESFIVSEYRILSQSFDRIIIIAQNVSAERTRITPGNVTILRYNTATSLAGFFYLPVLLLANSVTIIKLFKEESDFRKAIGYHLTFKNLSTLFRKIIKAVQLRDFIRKSLSEEGIHESVILYSYWLKTGAHAISMLEYKDSIRIARAHGSDIYEEKTQSGYLPLLKYSALNLDAIFFISKHGKEYFEDKIRTKSSHFIVSYLGVVKPDFEITKDNNSGKFVIVSCSNMVPLKRIDLIIYALKIVNSDKEIEWLHFGDGILKNEIKEIAHNNLGSSLGKNYRFMGYYPNDKLLDYYRSNQVNLFINTSSTEGVPVSIMEAQCFGIPVIATDTGGVKELVTEGTGSLLPVNFAPADLAKLIEYYSGLNEEESEIIRANAMRNLSLNFNASSNYKDFVMKVNSILASEKISRNPY